MSERQKILAGMLERPEFTVPELAKRTGTKKKTVYSVIGTVRDWIAEVGQEDTGGPGGRVKRYRLRQDKAREALKEVRQLYREVRQTTPSSLEPTLLPVGLESAWTTLIYELPSAETSEEKDRMLDLARWSLDAAFNEWDDWFKGRPSEDRQRNDAYLHGVTALIKLQQADIQISQESNVDSAADAWKASFQSLSPVLMKLEEFSELDLVAGFQRIIENSWRGCLHVLNKLLDVFLVDTIPGQDSLTNHVLNFFKAHNWKGRIEQFRFGAEFTQEPSAFAIWAMTVRSAANLHDVNEKKYLRVKELCQYPESMVVFDDSASNDLRNLVLKDAAKYEPNAKDLTDEALDGVFRILSYSLPQILSKETEAWDRDRPLLRLSDQEKA